MARICKMILNTQWDECRRISEGNRHFNKCCEWNERIECSYFHRSESILIQWHKVYAYTKRRPVVLCSFSLFSCFFSFVMIQVVCFWQLICGTLQFEINWQRHNVVLISHPHGSVCSSLARMPYQRNFSLCFVNEFGFFDDARLRCKHDMLCSHTLASFFFSFLRMKFEISFFYAGTEFGPRLPF